MIPANPPLELRRATAADEPFLWKMLAYAASMETAGEAALNASIATAQADPYLSCYVARWAALRGDLGIIARSGAVDVGAAWLRLGGAGGQFKLGDESVPELATAVIPAARAAGVGTALMTALIDAARGRYPKLVLSVRAENPALRFYERLGFRESRRMKNRVGGDSLVMLLDLSNT